VDRRTHGGPQGRPFARALQLWRDLPGATHSDGTTVGEPSQLTFARQVLGLLREFPGYTLTTLLEEDTLLLRLLSIERLGTPDEPDTLEGGEDEWPMT
jgi:hypothetical protein